MTSEANEASTRLCLSAWKGVEIRASGSVGPCCILPLYGGNLKQQTLLEIVNGPRFRALRRALLLGNLENSDIPEVRDACAKCTLFPRVPVKDLIATVEAEKLRNDPVRHAPTSKASKGRAGFVRFWGKE